MRKEDIFSGVVIADEEAIISVSDICHTYSVTQQQIEEMVELGVIQPIEHQVCEWCFDMCAFKRFQKALRLQHDLEVNLEGIAIILDLIDELEEVKKKLGLFESLSNA